MLVYIVRHGETVWNVAGKTQGTQDIPLSDKGREQAKKLARRLKYEPVEKIYCSDLHRAYETADIIGNEIDKSPHTTPLLREVCFGNWEGHTIEDIDRIFPGQLSLWYNNPLFCAPEGESIHGVHGRVKRFIAELTLSTIGDIQGIIIVSHALVSKVLILELLGMPISYIGKFKQDNAGLSIIRYMPEKSILLSLNDISHLRHDFIPY
jgi:broad specificity phosphatase PhoE